jgi:hypothetical protein
VEGIGVAGFEESGEFLGGNGGFRHGG